MELAIGILGVAGTLQYQYDLLEFGKSFVNFGELPAPSAEEDPRTFRPLWPNVASTPAVVQKHSIVSHRAATAPIADAQTGSQ